MATIPSSLQLVQEVQSSTIGDQAPTPVSGSLEIFANQNGNFYSKNSSGTVTPLVPAGVTSVTAADGSLTITPTTGAVTASRAALTGDITASAGSNVTTLKNTGPGATGPIGSATATPVVTIDAQGRTTALTSATIAPPFSAVTGQTTLAQLPSIGSNTVLGNATGSSATPTAISMTGTGNSVMQNAPIIKPKDIEGEVWIDPSNTQGWSGSDVGAQINSAYSYITTNYYNSGNQTGGGIINIAPGEYSQSTAIVANTSGLSITIRGMGDGWGATVLQWSPTSGTAMTLGGGGSNSGGVHLENITISGGSPVNTGSNGISLAGAYGGLTNVAVVRFGNGLNWLSAAGSYGWTFNNCKIQFNTTGVNPLGENNVFIGGLIGNNGTGVSMTTANGAECQFVGVGFDDNTTTAINVGNVNARATMSACRFENAGGGTDNYFTVSAGALIVLGGQVQTDTTTGTSTGFGAISGGVFTFRDANVSIPGSRTFTQLFNVTGGIVRISPQISPGSTGTISAIAQSGFTDQGTLLSSGGGVTSGTTATVVGNIRIPGSAALLGKSLRLKMTGNSSSTGMLIFEIAAGTAGTTGDTSIYTSATSAAQVANHRSAIEAMIKINSPGASGTIQCDAPWVRFSNLFVEQGTIAAPTTFAVNMTNAWFIDMIVTCSVGTFTVDNITIEVV